MRPQASPTTSGDALPHQGAGRRNAPERPHPRNPAGMSPPGLPASTRLFLGGLAWLAGCFLLVWLLTPQQFPAPKAELPHLPTGLPAPEEPASVAILQHLDALVEQILPQALPRARWQRSLTPPLGAVDTPALPANAAPRRYTVTGPCAPLRLALALLAALHHGPEGAFAARPTPAQSHPATFQTDVLRTAAGVLEIRVNGRLSHSFHFPGRENILMDLAHPPTLPALAVVMDDMGQRLEAAEALTALPFPVTLAIWPHAPLAAETARLAEERRLDSLIHLPMEALPRPDGRRPNPGPGALLTHMDARHLALTLEEDLQALPTAIGLNNHMGSAFTGDVDACRRLCALLAGRGYLVLDSVTRPHALLAAAARQTGLVSAERDIFLDSHRDPQAVLQALDAAAHTARRRGWAVAIGHPYGVTLAALRAWSDSGGVALVPLRRLVWFWARQQYAAPFIHPTNKE